MRGRGRGGGKGHLANNRRLTHFPFHPSLDFTSDFPARAAYAVSTLPKSAKVEIEMIAAIPSED